MKKRIVFLHRYDRSTASFRARCECYFESLREQDYEVLSQSLFSETYWKLKPRSILKLLHIFTAYMTRLIFLFRLRKSDQIILYVELFPYLPPLAERILHMCGIRWIYDIDDAFFHNYDDHRFSFVRQTLGQKMAAIMRLSDFVITGNKYLEAYARRHNNKVVIIPSVIDLRTFSYGAHQNLNTRTTIGWIGTPTTAPFLRLLESALNTLSEEYSFRILIIGSKVNPFSKLSPSISVELRDWSENREASDLAEMDIGVMPLPDTPFTRGKGGMKIMQYMAASIPAVASPVGFNCEIISHGQNGILAATPQEWVNAFKGLIQDPEARKRIGEAGYRTVADRYCIQVTRPEFVRTIQTLA